MNKIFIVAGTTASGKSHLAMQLARQFQAEIINADSQQQYAGLPLLTAQPSQADFASYAHHGYARLTLRQKSTVYDWLQYSTAVISWLTSLGRSVVVCGGTGLYLEALVKGLSRIPATDPELLYQLQQLDNQTLADCLVDYYRCNPNLISDETTGEINGKIPTKLAAETLGKIPEEIHSIIPRDRQRRLRALVVAIKTGHAIKFWQGQRQGKLHQPVDRTILLLPNRDQLRIRIRKRLERALSQGLLTEIEQSLHYQQAGSVSNTILGWRFFCQVVQGKLTLEQAVELTVTKTMQYAKRQSTWFRHRLPAAEIFHCFGEELRN